MFHEGCGIMQRKATAGMLDCATAGNGRDAVVTLGL